MIKQFITHYGFSYGYSDLEVPEKDRQAIKDDTQTTYDEIRDLISQEKKGTLKAIRGMTPKETLEAYIMSNLGKLRDRAATAANLSLDDDNAGKIMATTGARGSSLNVGQMAGALGQQARRGKLRDRAATAANLSLDDDNAGKIMATTGARGSSLNVGQMAGALGQQARRGNRLNKGYNNRVLTHFEEHENDPDAHGFVKSNYRDGLSTLEFFFHAMGGREGLVDTAVRTQQSGYMQRRLINALEHIKLEYDGTVRDPHGHIIQFLYGEDGIDVAKSDHGEAFNIDRLIESQSIVDSGKAATKDDIASIIKKYTTSFNPRLSTAVSNSLENSKLSKDGIEKVAKKGLSLYNSAKAEPGQAVGIVTAQSIGEPGTQMTLRTFHFAGIAERNVTLGLPRLIELVDARKKPVTPTMDIYLLGDAKTDQTKTVQIARNILQTTVNDLILDADTDYKTKITLNLNEKKLSDRGCTLNDVTAALESNKKFKMEIMGNSVVLNLVDEEADAPMVVTVRNKVLKTTVKGVPDIQRVTIVKKGDEYVIQTTGSNLSKVLEVQGIDKNNVRTNNVSEIAETLGIEAARNALINELSTTLEDAGLEVDQRYLMLVSDLMCHRGYMQQSIIMIQINNLFRITSSNFTYPSF